MIQTTRTAVLLEEMVTRYRLSEPEHGRFRLARPCRLLLSAGDTLSFYKMEPPFTRITQQRLAVGEMTSLYVAHTASGNRVACVDSDGRFCLWQDGVIPAVTTLTKSRLWHVTACTWQHHLIFLVCAADQTIHLLDYQGQPLSSFATPGRVLSLAVRVEGEQVFLVGGIQERPELYVWDLACLLRRQDATPLAQLTGGQKPAYTAQFAKIQGETWLLHGCWDGLVYGYRWPLPVAQRNYRPTPLFQATSPLYGLETVTVNGRDYLLAGAEYGQVMVWSLDSVAERQKPLALLACGQQRVRCVRTAVIDTIPYLLAGNVDGRFDIWQLPEPENPVPLTTIFLERAAVNGIGFLST